MRKCFMSLLSCVMAISSMSMSIAFASEEKSSITINSNENPILELINDSG